MLRHQPVVAAISSSLRCEEHSYLKLCLWRRRADVLEQEIATADATACERLGGEREP